MKTLTILDGSGDTKLTWDPASPEECENARQTVKALASQGYTFFLTDGKPADAVTAGGGTLLVRRLNADEVVTEVDPLVEKVDAAFLASGHEPGEPRPEAPPEPASPVKRRGRPPKAAQTPDQNVVAVRPMRGG